MTGASAANWRSARVSAQLRYSFRSSNMRGASGCQMPMSGKTSGSAMAMPAPAREGTYSCEMLRSRFSKFSALPPSQYCNDVTKLRASRALSEGRYLSTVGSVRTSLRSDSSKLSLFLRCAFMKSANADFPCPSCASENVPSLLSFMTAGIDGKTRHASSASRRGPTAATILSASSSMKMRDPMKTLAESTSALKAS